MKERELVEKIKGINTIEMVMDTLNVSRQQAIYYVHRLRKKNYVKTKKLSNNKRVYSISFENKLGGTSYYEIINKYSPIKIATPIIYKIHGQEITPEETLVYAITTKSVRTILASLILYRKITNWNKLYKIAKRKNCIKEIGALYDVTRKIIRVKRMSGRFVVNALPRKNEHYRYIIEKFQSNDFKEIEKKWKVYIPFNKIDFEDYKDDKHRRTAKPIH